jgi:hypothetical protein
MRSTIIALLAVHFTLMHAQAFIDIMVEIVPYREKDAAAATAGGGPKEPAAPSPGSASTTPTSATANKPKTAGDNPEKMMVVNIRNASKRYEKELIVRYWFIGLDMKTMRPALLDGGETSAELKPNASITVTSDSVKGSVVRTMPGPGRLGTATGMKVAGYAVQVIQKDKVIGEAYQEVAYKKLIGSEGKKPGPFFKIEKPDAPNP